MTGVRACVAHALGKHGANVEVPEGERVVYAFIRRSLIRYVCVRDSIGKVWHQLGGSEVLQFRHEAQKI